MLKRTDAAWLARPGQLTFVRSRNDAALTILDAVVKGGGTVINSPRAIRTASSRATASACIAAAGVPTAAFHEGAIDLIPFERAVIKERKDCGCSVPRLLDQVQDAERKSAKIVYAQEFIESEWEHKIYIIGEDVHAFVQRPTLPHSGKRVMRQRVALDGQLERYAIRAAKAVGLEVAGVDFLVDHGQAKVTDINSNQGLHSFPEGFECLERYILRQLETVRPVAG
ncbi:RimK family alpha-L-glutamate ligase [Streptomyces goshikiensis]|uniref:ATP-grasp domain-containing protein n=1 Tax=Streptomyces goshikiensis TaxID=1942 RepID=UPI0036A856F5